MKSIGKTKARKIRVLLREALKAATLNDSHFSGVHGDKVVFKGEEKDVTQFIKEMVKLYHQTWIICPIAKALEIIEEVAKYE